MGAIEDLLSNIGQEGLTIYALAIDPLTPTTIYAGTPFGVFRSTDSGRSWSQVNSGLTVRDIQALAVDPVTPSIIYAGTSGGHVFKSIDSGTSWAEVSAGLRTKTVNALAIDATTPTTLYAGTSPVENGPLYKSTNSGDTWSLTSAGLGHTSVHSLAINPLVPTTLYAGTSSGVFTSTDGGDNWTRVHTGAGVEISGLVIDPASPTVLYAGGRGGPIYRSVDGGESWSSESGNHYVLTLVISQGIPASIYAGTSAHLGSVLTSTDGGINWNPSGVGLPESDVLALAIDPLTPTTLYAGTLYRGVFKSMDAGANWVAMNSGLITTASTP